MNFTTPPCIHCHQTSEVTLTDAEVDALPRMAIQLALPDRDADFRELIKTGIHPPCWDAIFADDIEGGD